jgi:FMN phosphatase YigB (HAD superfamily)
MFQLIIFDLGGVLVQVKPKPDRLHPGWAKESGNGGFERLQSHRAVRDLETGRLRPEEFACMMIQEFSLEVSAADFLAEFRSWVGLVFPGAAELLAELHPHLLLACLSNTSSVHWDELQRCCPQVLDGFDHVFPSYRTGYFKPEPRAFLHVLEELAIPAASAFFLDDRQENVEQAMALGMTAAVVNGVWEARSTLAQHGVLPR